MKPILFNTPMTRAILDGRKTETRRLVKTGGHEVLHGGTFPGSADGPKYGAELDDHSVAVAPYQPGDTLYVREAYDELPVKPDCSWSGGKTYLYYRADGDLRPEIWRGNWKPSIHMPKGAARLFLHVTDVRCERLQKMTVRDLIAEGMADLYDVPYGAGKRFDEFRALWGSTIKPSDLPRYGWAANPWVWVITFERCEKPEAET